MKKPKQMNKVLASLLLFFIGLNPIFAQDFSRVYAIEKVEKSAWYKIYLTEEFRAFLKPDFADIRLFSDQNIQQEIPYILKEESLSFSKDKKENVVDKPLKGIQYTIQNLPNKTSVIKVFSKQKQWIHQMAFSIKNPMFYSREVSLYTKELVQAKRRKKVWQETGVGHFELRAHSNQSFALNHYLDDTLYIAVDNQDNMPLPIAEILFFQHAIHLFAYLEEDKLYLLKCGNTALSKPQYDLGSFAKLIQDSVARSLQFSLVSSTTETQIAVKEVPFYEQKYFLWICIFVGAITLFFFSWKLLQEKKNGE
jgi:hypothetical protein